jgi:hypothetical protein
MKNLDLKDLEILVTAQDFQKQLKGCGLTTANILCRRPDHPWLLQSLRLAERGFGRNLSKVSCIRSLLHIPASSNRWRSKQWVAFSGLISDRIDQRPLSLTKT